MKEILKIANFKEFQLEAIELLQTGKDIVIVQPTGSGKSLYYTVPALLNPRKITLVIEPVVAIITNQVLSLRAKGIDAVALGRAAGANKLTNFRRVFKSFDDVPVMGFCTPEYLFGTPPNGSYSGSVAPILYNRYPLLNPVKLLYIYIHTQFRNCATSNCSGLLIITKTPNTKCTYITAYIAYVKIQRSEG